MAVQQDKTKKAKGIKKSFFEVRAPLTSSKISLYASSIEELNGKMILLDLTKSLRGKSFQLRLRVKADEESAEGVPISLQLAGSYIRKMMRRGTDYVEDSFALECRDFVVRIKPFMITRNKVSREVRKALRENSRQILEAYLKTRTASELFSEVMASKLQKILSIKLRKVYPLAMCEIRSFEIEGVKKEGKTEEKKE